MPVNIEANKAIAKITVIIIRLTIALLNSGERGWFLVIVTMDIAILKNAAAAYTEKAIIKVISDLKIRPNIRAIEHAIIIRPTSCLNPNPLKYSTIKLLFLRLLTLALSICLLLK